MTPVSNGYFVEKMSFGPMDKETFTAASIGVCKGENDSFTASEENPIVEALAY